MALTQVATTGTLTMATVSAVAAGTITGVQYWNYITSAWQATAPAVSLGQQGSVGFIMTNTSGVTESLNVVAIVTKPDGTTKEYSAFDIVNVAMVAWVIGTPTLPPGTSRSAAAAAAFVLATPLLTLDQVGTWSVVVNMYASL